MQVRDVMTSLVVSINVDTPIAEAIGTMQSNDVHFLPVTHENVCAGVLTEEDIARQQEHAEFDPATVTAGTLLAQAKEHGATTSIGVHAISEDAPVQDAIEMMTELELNHLAVHDNEFVMVGVVSRADLRKRAAAER